MCNADAKVWISFDADGNVGVAGAGAQSGIEITFHCAIKA